MSITRIRMGEVLDFLTETHERAITIFGVMLVALGLLNPSGIVTVLVATYGIKPVVYTVAIIAGMFIKALSAGNVGLRLVGITPYTVFIALALSLWLRGITNLLQSQILYVVIWSILIQPLVRDTVALWRNHHEKKRA